MSGSPSGRAYARAGVDTGQADQAVAALVAVLATIDTGRPSRAALKSGHYANVLDLGSGLGLALSTDGVGSKVIVAEQLERYDTIGIDCIAMNVNDIICVGAEPLAVLDYIAVESAQPDMLEQIAIGLKRGAEDAGVEIPGGELAQLPELIRGHPSPRGFDLVGACFGTVALDGMVTGDRIEPGDVVIGLPSSGIHSNGYTLARSVLDDLDERPPELGGASVGDALLEPTVIYVRATMDLLEVRGRRARARPHHERRPAQPPAARGDVGYLIDSPLPPGPVFDLIAARGQTEEAELLEVFNMGCGFCCVVPESPGRGRARHSRRSSSRDCGDRLRHRQARAGRDPRVRPGRPQGPGLQRRREGSGRGMIGTLLGGRFRLERKLGSGGMSTVYRAFDETLERWVAIKLMHADITTDAAAIERFRREARAVARLSHPHVVSVIDAGDGDGHPYIVLEYVEGETLKALIRRDGPMDVNEAVAYAIEVGMALSAAHQARLVHRDVKPQNVLIDTEGRAKLTDFGISRSLEAEGLTQDGKVVGTTDYVSPEQALGQDVTGQSDIYSLGVCLYEMLTGQPPFTGESHVAVAMKHVQEPVPDVRERRPEVSAALALVVENATAKEQENRYATIDDMVHDLEQALAIETSRSGEAGGQATAMLAAAAQRGAAPGAEAAHLPAPGGHRLRGDPGRGGARLRAAAADPRRNPLRPAARAWTPRLKEVPLALDSVTDFDPEGDGAEKPEATANVVDGNRSTFWDSEGYTGDFSPTGLKTGVGLIVRADAPVPARQLDFITRTPGIDAQVYAAAAPATDLESWGPVIGSVTDAPENAKVDLDTAGQGFRYYLLWITKVVPDDGFNRASISEIVLRR